MPITYRHHADQRLIVVTISGEILPDDVTENRRRFIDAHRGAGKSDFLVLVKDGIDASRFDTDILKQMSEDSAAFENNSIVRGKTAFVVKSTEAIASLARLYRALRDIEPTQHPGIEVFEHLEDACAWLECDPEAVRRLGESAAGA